MIRKSTIDDKENILSLINLCFGNRDEFNPCTDLDDRYYLCFENNILVAMTGLIYNEEYNGLEIDWTCTHPDYRHLGYMKELFTVMLKNVKSDVFCSCWRLSNNDKPNLYTLMELFNFKEVIRSRVHSKIPYNCFRNHKGCCVYYSGEDCECYEDLYIRHNPPNSKT